MFYFPEIKCLDIAHLEGFYNLDKTLDPEFYCLKCCFKIISGTKQNSLIYLAFFATLCSMNGLQTIVTVETMNFRIPCFIKILQHLLGRQNLDKTIACTQFLGERSNGKKAPRVPV